MPTLGDRIRGKRAERDWTQEELARRAGLNPKTIGFVEADKCDPKHGTVARIADALTVTIDYLVHGENR